MSPASACTGSGAAPSAAGPTDLPPGRRTIGPVSGDQRIRQQRDDERWGISVLGLLLGQGAEWKIQTGSQHKECKNMTPR